MASRASQQYDKLVQEINEERAAALRRISSTLESLIEQVRSVGERIPSLHGSERARQVAAYRELRRNALLYRWYLEVQREAVGLRQHHALDEVYVIPGPIEA